MCRYDEECGRAYIPMVEKFSEVLCKTLNKKFSVISAKANQKDSSILDVSPDKGLHFKWNFIPINRDKVTFTYGGKRIFSVYFRDEENVSFYSEITDGSCGPEKFDFSEGHISVIFIKLGINIPLMFKLFE